MKKIMFYAAFFTGTILSSCDGDKKIAAADVPKPAMDAFNTKYPGVTDAGWIVEEKDNKKIYEAKFKVNGEEVEAEFDANGTFIKED